ncbi:MAG: ACP S-malonyltransferase [Pseudomonadota bacterium]
MARAYIFPGQGSQAVGMGKALADAFPKAREVFQEIDDALSQKLTKLIFEGPDDELRLTENAQPALMAVSLAVVAVLSEADHLIEDQGDYLAGHSLGEYSALTAAGAFSLADAARVLKARGVAMQRAVPVGQGAMAALLGLDEGTVTEVIGEAKREEVLAIENDTAPGQIVISGHKSAVDRAIDIAKTKGGRRSLLLPVSAPFHCPLMQPAENEMDTVLAQTDLLSPALPIVCNVDVSQQQDPEALRTRLVKQVTGAVRWRESIEWMVGQGVDEMVELGSGKVLAGLNKRINRDIRSHSIGTPDDIDSFLSAQ